VTPDTVPTMVLAHHPIVAALPFLVPTLLITLMVVVMAVRDRRRGDPDPPGKPGPPPD
jgi:hypothetical protein